MNQAARWALVVGAAGALGVAGGCGGGGTSTAGTGTAGKQGGKLTVLSAGDIDYLDPGQTYYSFGYMVSYAVNRTLYGITPSDPVNAVPDLADGPPVISPDNKTITVKIKKGIKYAPPVNREVTAADFKYAFERAFSKNVPSAYAGLYFASVAGAPAAQSGPITPISGIQAPDDSTLVITLTDPSAPLVVQALVMPITTPVPKEYASKYDASVPSTYDQYVAFTGPYMVKNDANGKVARVPGKSITIVRNPNWDKATDYRPAYLDEILVQEGNDDLATAARRALSGTASFCCDSGAPPAEVLKEALTRQKEQVLRVATGTDRFLALNTTVAPLDNLNIRKAIIAAIDRTALRLTRGGEVLGPIASGWIPPGLPGFDEAGGLQQNTDLDFLKSPTGDPAVARKYMDAAAADGLPVKDGKWTGTDKILTVAANADPAKKTAANLQSQLEALGFKLNLRLVPPDALSTKFCGVPAQKIAICFVAFGKDFGDPQTVLTPLFDGKSIVPQGNVNDSQLNVPAINDAMAAATKLPPGPARSKAWADINHQIAEQAPAIPYLWDDYIAVASKDVQGVMNTQSTSLDLTYTSIK